jgi:hypothetical protein
MGGLNCGKTSPKKAEAVNKRRVTIGNKLDNGNLLDACAGPIQVYRGKIRRGRRRSPVCAKVTPQGAIGHPAEKNPAII